MSEQVIATIELIQSQIQKQEQEIAEKKRVINSLCPLAGIPAIYADVDSGAAVNGTIRPDEFYGRPLAEAVRAVLDRRKQSNQGAATVQEIYEAMKAGGFHFQAKNDDYAKRGLYQSLMKNTATFHKLPNGRYGLRNWYPNVKSCKPSTTGGTATAVVDDVDVDQVEEATEEADAAVVGGGEERQSDRPRKPK